MQIPFHYVAIDHYKVSLSRQRNKSHPSPFNSLPTQNTSSATRCNTTSADETELLNNPKTPHSESDGSLDVAKAPPSFSNTK
jgi:hypothetical protein